MKKELFGELRVIGMKGCEEFVSQVDSYLKEWRESQPEESFLVDHACPRFGTGEAKCVGNYGASFLATELAKKQGYNQVLWLDVTHKYVEEVGTMNVMFVINGEVVTPALTGSILRGISRDSAIMVLREKGYKVREEHITLEYIIEKLKTGELTEMFGVGTAAIVSPVGTLGYNGVDYIIGENKPGPVGQDLYQAIQGIQQGRNEDKFGWVTHVKED